MHRRRCLCGGLRHNNNGDDHDEAVTGRIEEVHTTIR